MLLDPDCEALVVACTPEEIIEDGFPLDRCDLCVFDPQVKSWSHCGHFWSNVVAGSSKCSI